MIVAAASLAKSGEAAKAGPIGLAVILLLCIACYFLFKSMSKHMRRVRESFPADGPPDRSADAADAPAGPDAAAAPPNDEAGHRPPGLTTPSDP